MNDRIKKNFILNLDEYAVIMLFLKDDQLPFKIISSKKYYVEKQTQFGLRRIYYFELVLECDYRDYDLMVLFEQFIKEIVKHDTLRNTEGKAV